MYQNIPLELEQKVSAAVARHRRTSDDRYVVAAFQIAQHYINFSFSNKAIADFMGIPQGVDPGQIVLRLWVMDIGLSLFMLRNSSGFEKFCSHMKQRDFRSSFYELTAPRAFLLKGYQIRLVEPTSQKGADFDFLAYREDERINAEVTALTRPEFSEESALSALNKKRKQLPKNAPAVIFCVVPEKWLQPFDTTVERFDKLANAFMRSTARINALHFGIVKPPVITLDGKSGYHGLYIRSYYNDAPRIPWENARNIFQDIPIPGVLDPDRIQKQRAHEFYSWVDSFECRD